MSILITGSESFLGNFVKKKLNEKRLNYYGIDKIKNKNTKFCDILSKNLEEHISKNTKSIIHLAAISSSKDFEKMPEKAYDVNIKGTINLLNVASKKKIKNFIFASSEWVYGEASKNLVNENSPINSKKLYGPRKSKANWSAVESLIEKIYKKEEQIVVGSKKTARRFIHAEDVADAIIKCLDYKVSSTFNLSGDKLISLGEIISNTSKYINFFPKIIEKDKKNFNFRNTDNRLIKKKLKWKPKKILEKSIKEIIRSLGK